MEGEKVCVGGGGEEDEREKRGKSIPTTSLNFLCWYSLQQYLLSHQFTKYLPDLGLGISVEPSNGTIIDLKVILSVSVSWIFWVSGHEHFLVSLYVVEFKP